MKPNYYERQNVVHLDGTHVFQTDEDRNTEAAVAAEIASKWDCEIVRFGALSPIDWYGKRFGRLVGVLELKTRTHASNKFPTVFLNVRKWLALALASNGLAVPGLFVVKFTDCIRWTRLGDIDASKVIIGGCIRRVKADNDVEPVIEVSIVDMREL